jgi:hypothetical protein
MADTSLRASVTFVNLSRTATYVVPVSEIDYILLAVSAYLDTTGRFKCITDIFATGDSTALSTNKVADADTFALDDAAATSTTKLLADTTALNDSVVAVLIFIRDFSDTASLADSKTLFISPAYSDTFSTNETVAHSISKALADSFALNDLSDAAGPDWSFSDYTNNTVSTSDNSVVSNDKGLSDSFSLADSGTLISQGYCDITYFAEDYVGEFRTF